MMWGQLILSRCYSMVFFNDVKISKSYSSNILWGIIGE